MKVEFLRTPIIVILISIFLLLITPTYGFNLVGVWKLVSIAKLNKNGRWSSDCDSPTGLLIYTASGYMSAGINCRPNIPKFNAHDITFYAGRYYVSGERVVHLSQNSSDLKYYKKTLQRKIQVLNSNTIILTPVDGSRKNVRLTWRRIGLNRQ